MNVKMIEFWELYYLDDIVFRLTQDKDKMAQILNSKEEMRYSWIRIFTKNKCDIDRGAERIYYWLLNQLGVPNSTPIGADLLYETSNAFIHIDVKTSSYFTISKGKKVINRSDFLGVVSVGENQTSYKYIESKKRKKIVHSANLPSVYKTKDKPCLTYIIQMVYDKTLDGNLKILSIVLISIPNGALKKIYGDAICGGSKNKNEAFRYYYERKPYFEYLKKRPCRLKILYLNKKLLGKEEDIIGFKL